MAGKRKENLLGKIAALLEKDLDEVKQAAEQTYTEEEQIYEMQSVLNYYRWRKSPERKQGETKDEYEARLTAWKTKTCEGCQELFAYSYAYNGVKYCSLDCLKKALEDIGLTFTYGRPLNLRWGYRYPGVIPSTALKSVEALIADESTNEHAVGE